ncbi:MAG: guanylate kinase [Erysipelotrichaceae bacterium]
MEKGLIIILTGASSVGKGKIRKLLMDDADLKLFYSISVTTRPQKEGEIDGVDYYFVDHKTFAESVKNKELLEYTEFNGYYYGTPLQNVEFLVNKGKNVLIETESQGVGQIKLMKPESLAFFVLPKDIEELERQIRARYKDDEAGIKNRISKAQMEMELAPLFRHCVNNEDLDESYAYIKKTILEAMGEK